MAAPSTHPSLLVRLKNRQDSVAWGQFVEIYGPLIYGFARRHGLQDADAADVMQETLRGVAGAVDRLKYDPAKGSFRAWLLTVTRNKLRNWREKHKHQPRGRGATTTDWLDSVADSGAELEKAWDQDYERRLFHWASEQVRVDFEDKTWQAFWETAVEGRPANEVAASLKLSIGAVYIARSRVLARLRERIKETLIE